MENNISEHMKGIVNKNTIPTASDIQFQKTNPLARGDKNIKPLEVYAEHTEIRKLVYNEIRKLHDTINIDFNFSGHDIIIEKFLNCLTPLRNLHDPGRLPVYTIVPRSAIPDKRSCIWAVVSCLVQAYWDYELDDNTENREKMWTRLAELQAVNTYYPKMKIAGAENKGYWLGL